MLQIAFLTLMVNLSFIHADEAGAITVKSAADAATKWTTNASGAQAYYLAGVQNAGNTWQNNTIAAAPAYDAAVKSGTIKQMYAGGVKAAGAAKYQTKAATLGAPRFSQGVQAGTSDYSTGVAPYLAVIAGLTLPARAPRGSAANMQRVAAIATALNAKRLATKTAGG
jgi:hypothetical protein